MRHLVGFLAAPALVACTAVPPALPGSPASHEPAALGGGPIVQTASPTDLAIQGDAFFVLSERADPRSLDDLRFHREGDFHFEFLPGAAPSTGMYRLVNPDGLFVMGWQTTVDVEARPFGTSPKENVGADLAAFRVQAWSGPYKTFPVDLGPVALDHAANPEAPGNLSFDATGLVRLKGAAPKDPAGHDLNVHVALARPVTPGAARHLGGGYLAWAPEAGQVYVGTASNAMADRVIGKANVVRPGSREHLPMLTPSRHDRARYPDALDPRALIPGDPGIRGALVTSVRAAGPGEAGARVMQLVALENGVAGSQRWTVEIGGAPVYQRRAAVLRPLGAQRLARGLIVDVWLDAATLYGATAKAIVVDRDDRIYEAGDAFGAGWL